MGNGAYQVGEGTREDPKRWTIRGTLIHGITGRPVEDCDLPSPKTSLIDEGVSFTGKRYLVIDGYRYEVADSDWVVLEALKAQEGAVYSSDEANS